MTFYNRIDTVMLERLLPKGNEAQTVRLNELRAPNLFLTAAQKEERIYLEKELKHTGAEQSGFMQKHSVCLMQ